MPVTLTSKFNVGFSAKQISTMDLGEAAANIAKQYAVDLANGVLAGQADRLWSDTRTLAASGNDDLDLNGTTLIDALGTAFAIARVKALVVAAAAANTNNVIVGGAATNGFISWVGAATHTVTLRPGAVLALLAGPADLTGYAVTAATADLLRIANSGGGSTVTYDIAVVGSSA